MSSSEKACCSIPPVTSSYEPIGTVTTLKSDTIPEIDLYVVGPKDAKKAVLVVYDIIGFHNNTKQFCDLLAKYGNCKVVLPDFFRGKPWDAANINEAGLPAMFAWIHEVGTIEKIRPDINLTREWLKNQGVIQAGIVGFCWGGHVAVQMIDEGSFFGGASLIHPSKVSIKDAENAAAPILALPSSDEPDMTEYMEILAKKPFGAQCKYHRFEDMKHGFCSARGDYSNELVRKRATEAIQMTVEFFGQVLTKANV